MPRTFFDNKELKTKRIDTIVGVSLKLFATYGSKKVTIDMIVKECHYSHGLFYHYFASKDDVMKEIQKRSNRLFSNLFTEISKTSPVGYDFLRSSLCSLIDLINEGGESNYYVHLLFSRRLTDLNKGLNTIYLEKHIYNLILRSSEIVYEDVKDTMKKSTFKRYVILFLTLLDSLSLYKINYPNLFKKKMDGNVLFDRLNAFLKAKSSNQIENIPNIL